MLLGSTTVASAVAGCELSTRGFDKWIRNTTSIVPIFSRMEKVLVGMGPAPGFYVSGIVPRPPLKLGFSFVASVGLDIRKVGSGRMPTLHSRGSDRKC